MPETTCVSGEGLTITPSIISTKPKEFWGLSTATKPTTGFPPLAIFHEVDTGDDYYFYDGEWRKTGVKPEVPIFTVKLLVDGVATDVPVYPSYATNEFGDFEFQVPGEPITTGGYVYSSEGPTFTSGCVPYSSESSSVDFYDDGISVASMYYDSGNTGIWIEFSNFSGSTADEYVEYIRETVKPAITYNETCE